jgi:predicted lipoprotein with Yx(FWY)xxD motif
MHATTQHRVTIRRLPLVKLVAATTALFAVSALLLAPDAARAASRHPSQRVVVSTMNNVRFGTILVSGRTLYTLTPSRTACTAKCLEIWPALLLPKGATKATAGNGVISARLGTVKRANGALQVTYGGKPLFWFSQDTGAGQVKGNLTDVWGKWAVVVTKKSSSRGGAGTTTTTSPGGGTTTTVSPAGGGIGF